MASVGVSQIKQREQETNFETKSMKPDNEPQDPKSRTAGSPADSGTARTAPKIESLLGKPAETARTDSIKADSGLQKPGLKPETPSAASATLRPAAKVESVLGKSLETIRSETAKPDMGSPKPSPKSGGPIPFATAPKTAPKVETLPPKPIGTNRTETRKPESAPQSFNSKPATSVADSATAKTTTKSESLSGKSGEPTRGDKKTVTIEAKIDIGFGNTLYLRGEGFGLNWQTGVPLTCVDASTWKWSGEAKDTLKFKLLLNDTVWSKGEDLVAKPGQKVQVVPTF
jgi:hypothetical protein